MTALIFGIFKALNGKKTLTAQVAAIVLFLWGMFMPETAPTTKEMEGAIEAGKEMVGTITRDIWPLIAGIFMQSLAVGGSLHAGLKNQRSLQAVGLLVDRPVEDEELKCPVSFVNNVKGLVRPGTDQTQILLLELAEVHPDSLVVHDKSAKYVAARELEEIGEVEISACDIKNSVKVKRR